MDWGSGVTSEFVEKVTERGGSARGLTPLGCGFIKRENERRRTSENMSKGRERGKGGVR